MCDTLGFVSGGRAIFGKNSDRSPNEPQLLEYIPARANEPGMLDLNYCGIPQHKESHGVLLSRPNWMWGAEMGVNDYGVCIGNEAVFTKGAYGKKGLMGMDLVRLALERCDSAKAALELILGLLDRYGQGGNCGYDHEFFYDNSFLIMDRGELFVLETSGKEWVYKKLERGSISNRLSLGDDGDCYSGKRYHFTKKHLEPIYSTFSGSAARRAHTGSHVCSASSVQDFMSTLRGHRDNVKNPFVKGTVDSVCMHFGGLVGDHTTSSLIADLKAEGTVIWATGSSCPCVSLYKPWLFGTEPVAPIFAPDNGAEGYWREREEFNRRLLFKRVPEEYYLERDALQQSWFKAAEACAAEDFPALSSKCAEEEEAFFSKWSGYEFEAAPAAPGFKSRWEKKTRVLWGESNAYYSGT